MNIISYVKREDILFHRVSEGYYRGEMLPGAMEGIFTNKCRIEAGARVWPACYADRVTALFIFKGTGRIRSGSQVFEITERCLFCPDFDHEEYSIEADTEMEYLELSQRMSEEDWKHHEMYHIVLPWFHTHSNWHLYIEGFRASELKSYAVLHQYYVSRMSLGEVTGPGEARLEPHTHPELYQWFYGLPGTDPFLFKAQDEDVEVREGDWICIPNEVAHIVSPMKSGDYIDYVWFVVVVPGKEMCPYFY